MKDIKKTLDSGLLTHQIALETMPLDMAWLPDLTDPDNKVDPAGLILATMLWSLRYLKLVPPSPDKTIIQ